MLEVENLENGRVVVCTINRPEKRNAVNHATLELLGDTIDRAVAGKARALVLTGANGVFSAGADLSGVEDSSFLAVLRRALTNLAEAPFVTIAAVDGHALGAGVQLASFCDLRMATRAARFGIPAAKLGIAVDQATIARVVELVGGGPARAMLLAADVIAADQAHALGYVQRIGTLADAIAWATEIASLAPLTIQAHKMALSTLREHSNGPKSNDVQAAFERAWTSEDLQHGRASFLQRQIPDFKGK